MTRQEELVWAAAWVDGLRTGGLRHEAIREAQGKAAWAVIYLRKRSEDPEVLSSDDPRDTLLRQMAGEPDCFRRQGELAVGVTPSAYPLCKQPQGERCEACHLFGGWPEEKGERCPTCGAVPDRSLVEVWGTVYACRCGSAWVGGAAVSPQEAP